MCANVIEGKAECETEFLRSPDQDNIAPFDSTCKRVSRTELTSSSRPPKRICSTGSSITDRDFSIDGPDCEDKTIEMSEQQKSINSSPKNGEEQGIDTNLYSRQIGAFGMETMSKLIKMKVLISGLRGVGIEIAKNLILAGPAAVVLHDDGLLEMRDLATNFCATEADVQRGKSRSDSCVAMLAELNDYVEVSVHHGPVDDLLPTLSFAIFTNTPRTKLIEYNEICREQNPVVGFIAADAFGLATSLFVDFGNDFVIRDNDGAQPRTNIIAGITQDKEATVFIHSDSRMKIRRGDYVTFTEVEGAAINNLPPFLVTKVGDTSFVIGDTTGLGAYTGGGIVTQVKMPAPRSYASYATRCALPLPAETPALPVPDLGKFGRPEQLHFATQALLEYTDLFNNGVLPKPHDNDAVSQCFELAIKLNEQAKKCSEGTFSVDKVDRKVVENVVRYADCNISPLTSFLGGVAAQEVVKFTGRYTSIHQWLYFDAFELLDIVPPNSDFSTPSFGRFDDQIAIWGREFQQRIAQQNAFLVGAGALGCEFLKLFALVGWATSSPGGVTVTDMDNIEISNLNRQFLFRRRHVGKSKSLVAGEAARKINPDLKVETRLTRVGTETESEYDDSFWQGLNMVFNALDNIPSRLYIDGKCLWHQKPLLESGTLGTMGNVQVIIPNLTEAYGDSQDPPEQSIPLCTLKHFPNEIEHTIEWSRDAFEGLFTDGPTQARQFIQNPKSVLDKLDGGESPALLRERLQVIDTLVQLAVTAKTAGNRACIESAATLFHDHFFLRISQLLFNFPLDHVTSSGVPFWSGPKRAPVPIRLDTADPLHLEFIHSAANLYAGVVSTTGAISREECIQVSNSLSLPEFVPKQMTIKVDDSDASVEGSADDEVAIRALVERLSQISDGESFDINPQHFDKDDASNGHIDFMSACANLRARNYKIKECDNHKVKMIAGKIVPAIATTTAMITGLVMIEGLKAVTHKESKIELYRNCFIALETPVWVLSEPMGPRRTVASEYDPIACGPVRTWPEKGFTSWDSVEVRIPSGTLQQFVDHLEKMMNVQIAIVSVGNTCLYNSFLPSSKARLSQPLNDLYEAVSKQKLPNKRTYVACEISCTSVEDDVDIACPVIKCVFA